MINVNPHNEAFIMSDSRTFHAALVFEAEGTESVTTTLISAEVSFTIPDEDIRPGMVLTSSANVTVADDVGDEVEGKHFKLFIIPQLYPDGTTYGALKTYTHAELKDFTHAEIRSLTGEPISLGRFKATAVKLTGEKTTIEAHDDLYGADKAYVDNGSRKVKDIENYICNQLGITDGTNTRQTSPIDEVVLSGIPEGVTYREMLGFLAARDGLKCAMIDRTGKLMHKDIAAAIADNDTYTVSKSRSAEPEVERNVIKIDGIRCAIDDDPNHDLTAGQTGSGKRVISFSNPYMTQDVLNGSYTKYVGLTYKPLSAKYILGDPRLELLDIVKVEGGKQNASWTVPLTSLTYSYDGGLSCNLVSGGKTDAQKDTSDGPMTRYVKELVANKTTSATEALRQSMQDAINYIRDPITSGVGGYHFQAYNADGKVEADYWTDNPDLSQATNILMINHRGIAGTNNGINGRWRFAIDTRGIINADYILAGTLSAITLQSTNYNDTAGSEDGSMLNLANGNFSFAGGKFTGKKQGNNYSIAIEGKVTVSDNDSKAILDDAKLKLQRDNLSMGFVGTQTDTNNNRGIVFDLDLDADYMSWGAKDSASDTNYKQKFTYYRSDSGNQTAGFNMWAQLNMHNYDIVNADIDNSKIIGELNATSNSHVKFNGDITWYNGNDANIYRPIDMHNYSISNTTIVSSSDRRLKENIKDSEVNALDILCALKPREFDWKADGQHQELGFIADEMQAVCEGFAATLPDGMQGIKLLETVPYLIKAVQELKEENERLKERVSRLEHDTKARLEEA